VIDMSESFTVKTALNLLLDLDKLSYFIARFSTALGNYPFRAF